MFKILIALWISVLHFIGILYILFFVGEKLLPENWVGQWYWVPTSLLFLLLGVTSFIPVIYYINKLINHQCNK